MKIDFNQAGCLIPVGKNTMGLEDFRLKFVEAFAKSRTRPEIFAGYLKYLDDLEKILGSTSGLIQWINGSFVTNKLNPADIDLVSFANNSVVEDHEAALKNLLSFEAKRVYQVDGYIVRVYPDDHTKSFRTVSDKAYWNDWFENTKPDRKRKRYQKGYVEIKHL